MCKNLPGAFIGKLAGGRSNLFCIWGVGGAGTGRMPIGLSLNFGATIGEFCAVDGFCGSGGGCLLGASSAIKWWWWIIII